MLDAERSKAQMFDVKGKDPLESLDISVIDQDYQMMMLTWGNKIRNNRVVVFCDNALVVDMINSTVSSCPNCMYLIRLLTLNNLIFNRRVFAQHLRSEANYLADALSHLQFDRFWSLVPEGMDEYPTKLSPLVWPASKIWQLCKK